MADFPSIQQYAKGIITPLSFESIETELASIAFNQQPGVSRAWPSANLALMFPFRLGASFVVTTAFWENGSTVGTDSRDIGIYDSQGNKIASTGGVLTSGASAVQSTALSTTLLPGLYYLAMSQNGTTATVLGSLPAVPLLRAMGVGNVATSYPLPSTITYAGATNTLYCVFGISSRSVI